MLRILAKLVPSRLLARAHNSILNVIDHCDPKKFDATASRCNRTFFTPARRPMSRCYVVTNRALDRQALYVNGSLVTDADRISATHLWNATHGAELSLQFASFSGSEDWPGTLGELVRGERGRLQSCSAASE